MLHHRKFCSILLGYMAPEDGAGGGGGAAAPAAAPAAAAAAPGGAGAPPAGGEGAAAAGGAPTGRSLVGDATETPPAFDAAAAKLYLTEKGAKADELATLDEAKLKEKFDAAKAAEGKPAAAEDIQVKVPDGVKVDDKLMGDFKGVLADASLSPSDRAQKLFDMHAAALRAQADQPQQFWQNLQTEWRAQVAKDPEIGDSNVAFRDKVFSTALREYGKQYGEPAATELKEMLAMTGAGNNLHMARLIYATWKDRVEGGPTVGKPADAVDSHKKTLAAMYPTANVS